MKPWSPADSGAALRAINMYLESVASHMARNFPPMDELVGRLVVCPGAPPARRLLIVGESVVDVRKTQTDTVIGTTRVVSIVQTTQIPGSQGRERAVIEERTDTLHWKLVPTADSVYRWGVCTPSIEGPGVITSPLDEEHTTWVTGQSWTRALAMADSAYFAIGVASDTEDAAEARREARDSAAARPRRAQ